MVKRKQQALPTSDVVADQMTPSNDVFALDNVTQLRAAVDQAVYGGAEAGKPEDPNRAHTIEVLATLGQMGILTEMDLDEAKKGYL